MTVSLIRSLVFLALLLPALPGQAQADSSKTLSAEQLLEMVRRYHPVARQADVNIEKAKADVTIARGGFDPTLYNSSAQKTFDGTDYYYYNRPQLTLPTWFGVDIVAGTEFLSGNRLNEEETKGETSYFGVRVPLAKNLLMDKRRAALRTAKIFREASEVEKAGLLNNLVLEALNAYWNWTREYLVYRVLKDAVRVNEQRLQLVRIAWRQGDRPAIDTTEALTQLQNFQVQQSEAWLGFLNAGLDLSGYLWAPNDQPFNLPADITPDTTARALSVAALTLPNLDELVTQAARNHPDLQLYN